MEVFMAALYPYLFYYLAAVNVISIILMTYDKIISKRENVKLRIPEKTLLWLIILGGALGTLLIMLLMRHKTKHLSFKILAPLLLIAWAFICGAVIYYHIALLGFM